MEKYRYDINAFLNEFHRIMRNGKHVILPCQCFWEQILFFGIPIGL